MIEAESAKKEANDEMHNSNQSLINKDAVERSLERMLLPRTQMGSFNWVAHRESRRPGQEAFKNYKIVHTRFFFDLNIGEIVYFGNIQDVPENIKQNFGEDMFKVAVKDFRDEIDLDKQHQYRILDYAAPEKVREGIMRNKPVSKTARATLEEIKRVYNERCGFKIK